MIATKIGELTPYQDSIYLNRYLTFISTRIRKERFSGSHEHHIVPRCLFVEDDDFKESKENKTFLSFREHFIAHLLLHKICPEHKGLLTAAALMLVTNPKSSSRGYDSLIKKHLLLTSERWKDETYRANVIGKIKQTRSTEESRKKTSEITKRLYKENPEIKEKISKSLCSTLKTEEGTLKRKRLLNLLQYVKRCLSLLKEEVVKPTEKKCLLPYRLCI